MYGIDPPIILVYSRTVGVLSGRNYKLKPEKQRTCLAFRSGFEAAADHINRLHFW